MIQHRSDLGVHRRFLDAALGGKYQETVTKADRWCPRQEYPQTLAPQDRPA